MAREIFVTRCRWTYFRLAPVVPAAAPWAAKLISRRRVHCRLTGNNNGRLVVRMRSALTRPDVIVTDDGPRATCRQVVMCDARCKGPVVDGSSYGWAGWEARSQWARHCNETTAQLYERATQTDIDIETRHWTAHWVSRHRYDTLWTHKNNSV